MLKKLLDLIKDNKVIFILFLILLSYIFYIKFVKVKNKKKPIDKEGFISSDKFMGEMKGYIFKKDDMGLGYYIDNIDNIDNIEN